MKKVNETLDKMGYDVKSSLKDAFRDATKNPDFRKFVDKLNLNDEVLMKYTSQLETSFNEYSNCLSCKSIMDCKNPVKGYAYLPKVKNNKIEFYYAPCLFQKKLLKETSHLKNVYYEDVAKEIKEASMAKIKTDDKNRFKVIEYLTNYIHNYPQTKGLYLSGSFGSGKTYLIAAMFNELAKTNVRSAIIYWPEFLRSLKGSFQTDFNERVEYIKHVKLLLIDDLGAENTTAWGRDDILGPILQYRMQEELPTFFTSNLTIEELEQHFSVTKDNVDVVKAKRIIERINQLTTKMELLSKNLRQ